MIAPIGAFTLRFWDRDTWLDVKTVSGNTAADWSATFNQVTTMRMQIEITETQDDTARIWETAWYGPVAAAP